MSAYNLTKAAMVSLGETLNMELAPYDIGVTALCPGIIDTAIVSAGKIHFGDAQTSRTAQDAIVRFYRERGVSPDVVARDALAALRRNTAIKPTPLHVWPLYLLHRVSTRLYHRLVAGRWKKGRVMVLPPIAPPA
jgi:short-subunit dehydrogenase